MPGKKIRPVINRAIFVDDVDDFAETKAAFMPEIPYTPWSEDAKEWLKAGDVIRDRKPDKLDIYTDGSAMNNGYDGAKAGIGVWIADGDPRNLSCPLTHGCPTNQNAEMQALFVGAVVGKKALDAGEVGTVNIMTDSHYAIMCCTAWIDNWRRNEWMTSNRTPVLHKEWIEAIATILDATNPLMRLVKVKGHSGIMGNERADFLATEGAKAAACIPSNKTPLPPKPPLVSSRSSFRSPQYVRIGKGLIHVVSKDQVDPMDLE